MTDTEKVRYSNKAILVFLIFTVLASAVVELAVMNGGPDWLWLVLMWIPAAAAIAAAIVSTAANREKAGMKGFLGMLGIRRCKVSYVLLGILIPLVYLLVPYLIYWRLYPEHFAYAGVAFAVVVKDILPPLFFGIFLGVVSAIGEEIGWRGFLFPALLKRTTLIKALLVTGLIWAGWHVPVLAAGAYMAEAPLWYRLPAFVLCVLPIGIIAGLLTYKSNSIWPASLLHAAHNNYDQAVFGVITGGDKRMLYVSETGVLTILCAWVLALVLFKCLAKKTSLRKRKD